MTQNPNIICWLKTPDIQLIPVELLLTGNQKVVAFDIDQFPWREIEDLAIDLQSKGFKLVNKK